MNKILRAHLAVVLSGFLATPVYARTYTVQEGDTLSGISHRELGGPVWGSSGTLETVRRLNPGIKDLNLIYPNDVIVLSDEEAMPLAENEPLSEPMPSENDPSAVDADDSSQSDSQGSSRHRLRLLGVMSNTKIDAEAKGLYKTTLDSDVNTGAEFSYAYRISDNTLVGFSASMLQSEFAHTKDGRFKGIVKSLKGFSLDVEHRLAESFRLGGFAGVQQFYFVKENSGTSLTLEPVFVDNLGVVFAYDAIRTNAFDAGIDVRGTYASPAEGSSFDVKPGRTYGASLFALFRLNETFGLLGSLFYDRRIQDTSGTSQRNTDTGLKFGAQAEL